MKNFLITVLLFTLSLACKAQTVEYLPLTESETFMHIYSQKEDRMNAAILCVKTDYRCLVNNKKLSIKDFVKYAGYKNIYEYNVKTMNGVPYFVIFVWR